MIGMQYNLQGKGLLEAVSSEQPKWKNKEGSSCASNEPISVLDTRRSPSPSTSTSTLSSSLGGGATTAQPDNKPTVPVPTVSNLSMPPAETTVNERKDEWASELQPIPAGLEVSVGGGGERFGVGLEDWDSLLCESGPEQSLIRWITSDVDVDCSFGNLKQLIQGSNLNEIDGNVTDQNSNVVFNNNTMNQQIPILGSSSVSNTLIYQQQIEALDEKPQIFNPFMNQSQGNLFPLSLCPQQQDPFKFLQPNPKRQNLGIVTDPNSQIPKQPFMNPQLVTQMQMLPPPPPPLPLHLHKPLMVPKQEEESPAARHHNYHQHQQQQQQQQQQVVYDQLYKASELILAGNFSHAQGILARLNHQLSSPVVSKPLQRVAIYFKEALMLPLLIPNNPTTPLPSRSPTAFDGMFKMGAYKFLSEISPILQFVNFTSNQALLEALDHDSESIHIIDFDVGFGAQWASFMQELPGRNRGGSTTSLKITAFASPLTHHPLELGLMHENLSQFANEIGVNFELEVVNFDAFDPNAYSVPLFRSSEKEEIVVNFPIWACSNRLPMLPALIRFVKQLSPKIVVSLERGCERSDLPFSHHLLHALQYYEVLLDSIDAANATSEVMNKIERFLLQPRIESIVLGRLHAPDQMPHWKALFASAGFSPVAISNFAEAQAECVLKRTQVRGFHVEKRQASLALFWQRRELVSASAWRC